MAEFLTLEQLYSQPEPELRFLIEGVLPSSGLTFLIGKPKSGKSTLVRQLIAAVAMGTPFLGFHTVQASVLYYGIEERDYELRRHFREMDLPLDAGVETYTGTMEPSWLEDLNVKLESDPAIKLVVLDPLLLAVNVKDANDYAPMMRALSPLRTLAREFEIAIVCVHHGKKALSADAGDNVLGSTALRGSADATWQIIRGLDGTRTFQTEMRYGTDLPPTTLVFDEDNHTSRLGNAEAAIARHDAGYARSNIRDRMLTFVTTVPKTREEIMRAVPGNTTLKCEAFRKLQDDGLFTVTGAGVKGNPFLYLAAIPTEGELDELLRPSNSDKDGQDSDGKSNEEKAA